MIRPTKLALFMMVPTGVALTGCMPRMTIESIREMQPQRAPELDRLEMLIGDWETTGEVKMTMLDETIQSSGTNHAEWSLDRRFLIEHADLDMGALGKMTGISIWSWDPRLKKYRMWWFDSLGETSQAIVTYNERTSTFHMKAVGQKYGYKTRGRGTLHHVDDDTIEWTWREWDGTGLFKLADMKGTSKRKQ